MNGKKKKTNRNGGASLRWKLLTARQKERQKGRQEDRRQKDRSAQKPVK